MFTPPDGQRVRRFPGSQLKHPIFNQNNPSVNNRLTFRVK